MPKIVRTALVIRYTGTFTGILKPAKKTIILPPIPQIRLVHTVSITVPLRHITALLTLLLLGLHKQRYTRILNITDLASERMLGNPLT
jgi:hypothetical protein